MLAQPDKRLANTNLGVLSDPSSHDVEIFHALQRNALTRRAVDQLSALVAKVTVKAHVGASTDRQQWFVDVRDLKDDALTPIGSYGHHLATSLTQVGYVRSSCNFMLNSFSRKSVLENANSFARGPRHDGDACTRVDRNLYLDPLIGILDCADAWSFHLLKNTELPQADRVVIIDDCNHRLRDVLDV